MILRRGASSATTFDFNVSKEHDARADSILPIIVTESVTENQGMSRNNVGGGVIERPTTAARFYFQSYNHNGRANDFAVDVEWEDMLAVLEAFAARGQCLGQQFRIPPEWQDVVGYLQHFAEEGHPEAAWLLATKKYIDTAVERQIQFETAKQQEETQTREATHEQYKAARKAARKALSLKHRFDMYQQRRTPEAKTADEEVLQDE